MRTLSLNEKITIKDALAERGIFKELEELNLRSAMFYWGMASSTSIATLFSNV